MWESSIGAGAAFLLSVLVAGSSPAAVSADLDEWKKGPERWIMSSDDHKALKKIATDEEAAAFIDLFWARRDPTPGTTRNEFREEFLARVAHADAEFAEKNTRGALTDRGQVYIVLGPPLTDTRQGAWSTHDQGRGGANMSSGAAARGGHQEWVWSREEAKKLGVPRLEAFFDERPGSGRYLRDVRHGQFANVAPSVIRAMVVSPQLTTVPEWAAHIDNDEGPAARPPDGKIGRAVLFRDISLFDANAEADPIAALPAAETFAAESELAWAVEYCGASDPLQPVAIAATVRGQRRLTDPPASSQEGVPSPMKAVPGCSVVLGLLPLYDLKPGSYELVVALGTLEVRRAFRIE